MGAAVPGAVALLAVAQVLDTLVDGVVDALLFRGEQARPLPDLDLQGRWNLGLNLAPLLALGERFGLHVWRFVRVGEHGVVNRRDGRTLRQRRGDFLAVRGLLRRAWEFRVCCHRWRFGLGRSASKATHGQHDARADEKQRAGHDEG
jgi:hypothetical protein